MPQPQTDRYLDEELGRYALEIESWSMFQLAALYAAIDLTAIDASFAVAVPRLTALYAQIASAAQQAASEYVALKGALSGLSVVHDWQATRMESMTALPSGLPVNRYFSFAPFGVKALIRDGMAAEDALKVSKGRSAQALGTIPHLTMRQVLANVALAENTVGIEWPTLAAPPQTPPRILHTRPLPVELAPYVNDTKARPFDTRRLEDFANTSVRPPDEYLTADGLHGRRRRVRWRRVPRPNACDFCLTLATRGAVYSRATVDSVGKGIKSRRRNIQPNGGRYHFRCRCRSVLEYEGLPDLVISREDWQRLSTRDAEGNLPTFGIKRWRYTIESFSYAVYDGPEPPFPRWNGSRA